MADQEKKFKLVFAQGCFDDFDGSQEELDEMIAEIERQIDTGEFFDNSREITDEVFEELTDSEQERLTQYFEGELAPKKTIH
jgi:hypothetical protein